MRTPILETERLILCPFCMEDASDVKLQGYSAGCVLQIIKLKDKEMS